ncbi:hypothetical protein DICPUDRAFT_80717 [Dictyostelium purpureum]|uniref:Uncharacterized protein n=1 Tax=Dictyostelium purpureum TaxID=5786 RepID=F0ZRB3_DICPU|nr:uncharacterized protein DICPUDRAFT_80717 [Dictyostelium purpureum]EGC33532.1 hypothetical protein DICPUDRAFT_80717 [Dictyostelium purpureum]|eukprot:XP_003289957.1 hypothetical protein DICPUDRAFT_80717 [Dictyostelium purpureum]
MGLFYHHLSIKYHQQKQLTLSSVLLKSIGVKLNIIKTTIGTGNIGSIKVNFTQNTITWSGNIYPYYTTEKECSSKYHEHGICDKTTGTYKCNSEYTGFDRSSPINNNNNNQAETETNNNGTVIIVIKNKL